MSPKCKHEWRLSRAEAAALLRELADTLEQGDDEVCRYGITLDELIKFKIRIDLDGTDAMEVQFKGKGTRACGGYEPETPGSADEKYGDLKKRMQAAFKALRQGVETGMPSGAAVSAFLGDAEKLLTHKGFGDEGYPAFATICARLRTAFDAADREQTAAAVNDLELARKRCHQRHKRKDQNRPAGS